MSKGIEVGGPISWRGTGTRHPVGPSSTNVLIKGKRERNRHIHRAKERETEIKREQTR